MPCSCHVSPLSAQVQNVMVYHIGPSGLMYGVKMFRQPQAKPGRKRKDPSTAAVGTAGQEQPSAAEVTPAREPPGKARAARAAAGPNKKARGAPNDKRSPIFGPLSSELLGQSSERNAAWAGETGACEAAAAAALPRKAVAQVPDLSDAPSRRSASKGAAAGAAAAPAAEVLLHAAAPQNDAPAEANTPPSGSMATTQKAVTADDGDAPAVAAAVAASADSARGMPVQVNAAQLCVAVVRNATRFTEAQRAEMAAALQAP